jgi:hypothetical protein
MRYGPLTLLRFSIRDVLLMTAIVALALAWTNDRMKWAVEKEEMIRERDAAVENERRVGELRAREAAGTLISAPARRINPQPLQPNRPR